MLAGAFLLLVAPFAMSAAERLTIAAERADGVCPAEGPPLGVIHFHTDRALPPSLDRCLVIVPVVDVSDAVVALGAFNLAKLNGVAAVVLDFTRFADDPGSSRARLPSASKPLSSAVRSDAPAARIALGCTRASGDPYSLDLEEGLGAYFDAVASAPGRVPGTTSEEGKSRWILVTRAPGVSAPGQAVSAIAASGDPTPSLVALLAVPDVPPSEVDWEPLRHLQRYWTADVSRDPTATVATRADGSRFPVLRFFDGKKFTPVLLLPEDPAGRVTIELSGGTYAKASVENLASGVKRDFELRGAKTVELDLARGPLAVVLEPAKRPDTRTSVEVGATRGLTADEIIARERAWDAGQREKVSSFTAEREASLRFRVADVNETFDLTIRGPFFFRRGEPADWVWKDFYLNGVKWKGKTLPKIPILEP
jgi:hypothetical protein